MVVLVSVGILAYLTNQNTASQFQQYIQSGSTAYTQRVGINLAQHYTQEKSWSGVQEILIASLRTNGDRLVLADNTGKIIGDTASQSIGKPAASLNSSSGVPIQANGQTVGTLIWIFRE